ncbi:AMP-binding protein, partial [Bacillus sp. APMAM]
MQQSVLDIKQVTLEEVSLRILDIVKKIAGIEDMQLSDEIVGYNLSSLKIIRLLGAIEETYPITINFADFIDKNTIQDFCEWVYSQLKLDMESNHSDLWGIQNFSENRYEEFELTNIQTAYLMGRDKQFELGGISTHAYLEIQTELDMEKLNVSLQKVIDRQDMLRAYFLPNGKQRVLEKVAPYKIPIENVSSLSEGELEGVILKERDRMSHFVFDPFKWPLFEFKALRLMENKYYLFFGIDMLIADGASIQILFKEIFEHYYCNSNSEIKPLEINYRDYMLSYSQIKETKKYQEDKEFWEKKLSDFPQAPQLPLTNNLEAVTKPTFIRRSKIYHHEQWANIVKECSKHNIRPTMFLLTCYAKALAKWSNQSEFILNTTVFNRYPVHKDVNQIIGDFTSLLLIDIHLDEKGEIWSEACKIQNHFLEAFEHRDYDGIDFSRELMKIHNYSKGKAIAPIVFTSMLFDDEFQGIDVIGKLKYGISQTSQVYLDHQIIEVGNGIMLSWDYISELFEEQIIEEMFEEYIHIVESAVNSEVEVSPRSLHLKQLLENYNQTSLHREPDTLHNMFIQGVQRTPSHIAIEGYEKAITYKELDITSNKIASYLIRTGVKPGEFVGVLAEREWETIANILGV